MSSIVSNPNQLHNHSLDASVIINLNATGRAQDILGAIPYRFTVIDVVVDELSRGIRDSRKDLESLRSLISSGLIAVESLTEESMQCFETLVLGPAAETLDDGEAATIAYASQCNAVAVIDERKATRICRDRFPMLSLRTSCELLSHVEVLHRLGPEALAEAVFRALTVGRMQVSQISVDWVVTLIGVERAAKCTSLPQSVRSALISL